MTNRTVKNESGEVISSENYTYDSASNITDAPNSCFVDVGPFSIASNGDVSVSIDGSFFALVGVSGKIGVNLSEFFRGVFE